MNENKEQQVINKRKLKAQIIAKIKMPNGEWKYLESRQYDYVEGKKWSEKDLAEQLAFEIAQDYRVYILHEILKDPKMAELQETTNILVAQGGNYYVNGTQPYEN